MSLQRIPEVPGLVWRRSCCLDEESCEACKKADGSIISQPDEDLSKICTSPDRCRCIPYANLTEKANEGKVP